MGWKNVLDILFEKVLRENVGVVGLLLWDGLIFHYACSGFDLYTYLYKKKKKNGSSFKIDALTIIALPFFLLLSGSLFVYLLLDLPNVLANKTEQYKGDCEVFLFEGSKTNYTSIDFDNHMVTFPPNYQGVKEGIYYCEVNYYPRTETGASLQLYKKKGGELVNP
ncbi:hypothetical protein [Metaplanococcus flavidus]|uniref:Uncharacterized protein n=1 Tax=Metaplanococcus flavidus TaxID=569883 RepID=A0ABW3L8H5_9BACL